MRETIPGVPVEMCRRCRGTGSVVVHYRKAPMATRAYPAVLCAQCGGAGRRQYGIARETRKPKPATPDAEAQP